MTDSTAPDTMMLVQEAKGGRREAYDLLFGRAADRVLAFIRLRLGEKLRAEHDSLDILQEAYLDAHRDFSRFECKDDGSFARWLCAIAEQTIRTLANRAAAAKRRAPGEREHLSAVIEHARSIAGPASLAAHRERIDALGRALDQLDEPDRRILLLRFFADMTTAEISASVGIPETSVRRALARATVTLGTRLAALRDSK